MRTLTMPFRIVPSRRGAAFPAAPRPRRGFTIVEAIVAIVMLAAGVLALVSSSAVVLNQMTTGSQNTIASTVASHRLERLRSLNSCAAIVSGSAVSRGMNERWTVDNVGGGGGQPSRNVIYDLTYQAGRAQRTQRFITNIPCTLP